MAKKKFAIVGANSFLATYVIKQLHQPQYSLHLWGKREPEGNTAAFSYFSYPDAPVNFEELLSFDTIIYTAGAGIQSNISTTNDVIYAVNAFVPINLIQYLQDNQYKGHVITFGSYFEIGNSAVEKFYTEEEYITNDNNVPNNYCISKRLLAQYIYQKVDNLPFHLTHLVLPNIYGVGENNNRIIPYLVESIKNKKPLHLSSGTQKRQYLHVKDVAQLIEKVADQPVTGIYNLGVDEVVSVRDIVQLVVGELQDKEGLEINFGAITKADTGMQFLALNPKKAAKDLAWKPAVSLLEGIRQYF